MKVSKSDKRNNLEAPKCISGKASALVLIGPNNGGKGYALSLLEHKLTEKQRRELVVVSVSETLKSFPESKKYMDKGELVPQYIVKQAITNKIDEHIKAGKKLFIFDGLIRSKEQANFALELFGKKLSVLEISVSKKAALERASKRYACNRCKSTFAGEVCTKCGAKGIKRPDDQKEIAEKRYNQYIEDRNHIFEVLESNKVPTITVLGTYDDINIYKIWTQLRTFLMD